VKKCLYCKKRINEDNIRCPECDDVWQAGYKRGEESMKDCFRDIFGIAKALIARKPK